MSHSLRIIINGVEYSSADACISVFDRGFQFGDGLFETIPVRNGEAIFLVRHLARLEKGCQALGIPMDFHAGRLQQSISRLIGARERGVLKIIITRGESARGYACPEDIAPNWVLSLSDSPAWPRELFEQGVETRLCRTQASRNRSLAGIKHLNRLENVLARRELGADEQEGLLLDDNDCIVEGTMTNLFAVKNGVLMTPDLTHSGVCGIMRDYLLELAEELALPVRVEQIPASELAQFDELFVCNSLIGIWPIKKINHVAKYKKGPVTEKLQQVLLEKQAFLADA